MPHPVSCSVSRAKTLAVIFLALGAHRAGAFEVEPSAPTRCDDLVVVVTRSFSSACGWSAVPSIRLEGSTIDVSLELHSAGDICLPVALEHTFRIALGAYPIGDYTIVVSWTDLDRKPEELAITITDVKRCPEKILRGDANGDRGVDLADAVFLLFHLYFGEAPPSCPAAGDANADGSLELPDAVFILEYLFLSGPVPQPLSEEEKAGCPPA